MTTPTDTAWVDYDYAILRVVPHVHLGAFLNIGVLLHARTARFLDLRLDLDAGRLEAFCPTLDRALLDRYAEAYRRIAHGAPDGGPIALLPPSERFHWLTAPRSAVLQASEVHAGRTRNPAATLTHLFEEHVRAG